MRSLRGAALRAAIWVVAVLLLAEGAVRAAAYVLRRDAEVSVSHAGGDVIYCVGDSFTYGQGVRREEAWPQVLGGLLRDADANAPKISVLAEPGRSSSVAVVEVAHALKAGDARLILILAGWNANDGDFAAYAAERRQSIPWTSTVELWLDHSRLYRVAKQAVTYRSRTLVLDDVTLVPQTAAMSLYDFRAYQEIAAINLRRIAELCRAAAVPCALLTYPHQLLPPNPYTRSEYYHALFGGTPLHEEDYLFHDRRPDEIAIDAVIRHVAENEDLPLIDLQPAFARVPPAGLFLADFHHPTPAGHDLIAHTVFEAIRRKTSAAPSR